MARSGYPVRLPHPEFYARYRCLATTPAPALAPPSSSSAFGTTGDGANGKGQGKGKGGPQQGLLGAGAFPYHVEDLGVGPSREWCQRVLDAVLTLQVRVV